MEAQEELERIKQIVSFCEKDDDKVNFLLRQVEQLIETRNYYKENMIYFKNIIDNDKNKNLCNSNKGS